MVNGLSAPMCIISSEPNTDTAAVKTMNQKVTESEKRKCNKQAQSKHINRGTVKKKKRFNK